MNTLYSVYNPKANWWELAVLWWKILSLTWHDYSFNRITWIDWEIKCITYQSFSDTWYYLHPEYVGKELQLQEFIDLIKTI